LSFLCCDVEYFHPYKTGGFLIAQAFLRTAPGSEAVVPMSAGGHSGTLIGESKPLVEATRARGERGGIQHIHPALTFFSACSSV